MRMNKLIILLVVLSLAIIGLNCKDDEESSVIPEKYIGTWGAGLTIPGSSITYTLISDTSVSLPLHLANAKVTATLNRDGSYTLNFFDPSVGEDDISQGTVRLDEDLKIITLVPNDTEDETLIFAYEWDGDNTLILITETTFDITLQGNPEVPVKATIVLKRIST
jgi:hypothetical protein